MPDPGSFDNKDDFISACIVQRQDEHPDESSDQSTAVCMSMWEEKGCAPKDEPKKTAGNAGVIHKTFISKAGDSVLSDGALDFVLSDATPDRYGDVIDANGWVLDNFKRNPIALFNHNADFPVGRWENLGVKGDALRGHLRMAPAGISPRIDELRALINAGILKAVSVGFMPLESQARSRTERGERYTKQELVETSLVSVPANPNAVLMAKSLRISDDTMNVVFGKHASTTTVDRSIGDYTTWKGQKVLVKRHVIGEWRGQKIYSSE